MVCNECLGSWQDLATSQLSYSSTCNIEGGKCRWCTGQSNIEKNIRKAVSELNKLLELHQRQKTDLNLAHSDIIRRLPPEVMSNIFQLCIQEKAQDDSKRPSQKDIFMPYKISAVCRTWRQLAWSTPQLWTRIVVLRSFIIRLDRVDLVNDWISRSKSLPINLCVDAFAHERQIDGGPPEEYRPFLRILARCSPRWFNIDLNMPTHFLKYLFDLVTDMSTIDTLCLRPGITNWTSFQLFNRVIPAPRRIIASGLLLKQININWDTVTHAKADDFSVEDCLDLLHVAPMIEECHLVDVGYSVAPWTFIPLIHNKLRHISFTSIDTGEDLFSVITLPSLQHFRYDKVGHRCRNNSLLPFFQRSASPLTKLELLNVEIPFTELQSLLELMPTLKHLHLTMPPELYEHYERKTLVEPFLQYLIHTSASSAPISFLPGLECLEYSLHVYDNVDLPWRLIPAIVAPLLKPATQSYDMANSYQRPLGTFKFNDNQSRLDPISRILVTRIIALRNTGARIFYNESPIENSRMFKFQDDFRAV